MRCTISQIYSDKFEKWCISLSFITRIYQDARSSECQNVMQTYVFSEYSKRATVLSLPSSLISIVSTERSKYRYCRQINYMKVKVSCPFARPEAYGKVVA